MEPVSVIIPTYNRAHLLPRAVASALAAMRPQDELIVVDDGSTDATDEALAPFRGRIRYLRTENRGAGPARNFGIEHARSRLVAFLDSDDEWMPDALELKRALLEARPDLVFCFTDFANRTEDGSVHSKYLVSWHHDERSWDDILGPGVLYSSLAPLPPGRADFKVHVGNAYPLLLHAPYVPAWTALVRRDLAGSALVFAEDLPTGEDWLCFGRVAARGPAAFLDCETAWNYGHSGPRITSTAGAIGYLDAHLALAERVWGTDGSFLKARREEYEEVVTAIHVKRARWYLSRGQRAKARADIRAAGGAAPAVLRVLAALPVPVLQVMGLVRRFIIEIAAHI